MTAFNIFLTGVGGQGIGLLSEVILRAADYAGHRVKGVDTHGLAQRGGIVASQIRMGEKAYSPLIPARGADLVVALERHEALRGADTALKNQGKLIYYNTVWQPLEVRLNQSEEISEEMVLQYCRERGIEVFMVFDETLRDARMQNMVLLSVLDQHQLVPGVTTANYRQAMEDLMEGPMLEKNMRLFEKRKET